MVPARPARTHSSNRAASRSWLAWGSAASPASANPVSRASARASSLDRQAGWPGTGLGRGLDNLLGSADLGNALDTELAALLFAYSILACSSADAAHRNEHLGPRLGILKCVYPLRFQHFPLLRLWQPACWFNTAWGTRRRRAAPAANRLSKEVFYEHHALEPDGHGDFPRRRTDRAI